MCAEAGTRAAAPFLAPLFSASGILPSLRSGQDSLDEADTIKMPASLRSDGVLVHPGMPFRFLPEYAFSFTGIPTSLAVGTIEAAIEHKLMLLSYLPPLRRLRHAEITNALRSSSAAAYYVNLRLTALEMPLWPTSTRDMLEPERVCRALKATRIGFRQVTACGAGTHGNSPDRISNHTPGASSCSSCKHPVGRS